MSRAVTTPGGPAFHAETGRRRSRVLRAVAGSSLGSFVSISTVMIFPYSVLAEPIAHDFGWTRPFVLSLIGPALLVTIPAQPLIGWAVTRLSHKTFAVGSMLLLAAAALLMANSPSDKTLFPISLAIAIAASAPATTTVYNAIVSEAVDQGRGLMLGVASAFAGAGVAILPLLVTEAIGACGWRGAYLMLTILCAVSAIALYLILPYRETCSKLPGPRMLRSDVTAAMRNPVFWQAAVVFLIFPIVANAVPLHLPAILEGRGADERIGATSLAVLGVVMIASRPLTGAMLDFVSVKVVMVLLLTGPLLGSFALLRFQNQIAGVFAAAGYGLAIGGEFVCLGYIVSRAFMMRSFGAIYGLLAVTVALGVSVGPILVSLLLSSDGSYSAPLFMVMGASLFAMLIVSSMDPARLVVSARC